jgi:hypothetical protein
LLVPFDFPTIYNVRYMIMDKKPSHLIIKRSDTVNQLLLSPSYSENIG